MAPVKFDDLSKTAGSVLDDDYQTSGYEFSTKQKTSWNSAVASTTVNFALKDPVQTPAKIGWKIPAPLGLAGFTVDKLEMDKAGKFKLETSLDKSLHAIDGLKVEVKSDLADVSKITSALTFTGIADTQIKLDAPVTKPDAFTLDLTRNVQSLTLGLKCGMANVTAPDVGARFVTGPLFASLLLKNKFSAITAHAAYTASPELKLAATCVKGKDVTGTVGVEFKASSDTTVKAKVQQDTTVSASLKHSLVKGMTLTAGAKREATGKLSYGLKVSVE